MDNEYSEYLTFMVTTQDGSEAELAIVDKFNIGDDYYIAAARVIDDTIQDDGVYIYKSIKEGHDFYYEQIEDADEYERVAEFYANKTDEE